MDIKFIGKSGLDLLVLEQFLDKPNLPVNERFELTRYQNGINDLSNKFKKYFKEDVPLPYLVHESGKLEEYIKNKGVTENVASNFSSKRFYNRFIEHIYLKSPKEIDFDRHLNIFKNWEPGINNPSYEKIKPVIEIISENPKIIDIREKIKGIYNEVSCQNMLHDALTSYKHVDKLFDKGKSKSLWKDSLGIIAALDLVITTPNMNYIIELKSTHSLTSMKTMKRQFTVISEYLNRNFDINFTLVGVNCSDIKEYKVITFQHYKYDQYLKEINRIK